MVPGGFEELSSVSQNFNVGPKKWDLQVICDSRDSVHLVDDPASHGLEQIEGELVGLGAHEVTSCDSTEATKQVRTHISKTEGWVIAYITMYP